MPDSAGDWDWDCFVAEAGVCLLKSAPDSAFARDLVANGIASYHYGTTRKAMSRAYRLREVLGADFERMQQLAIQWAFVRRLRSQSEYYRSEVAHWQRSKSHAAAIADIQRQLQEEVERWRNEHVRIIEQFVRRQLEPMTLQQAASVGHEQVELLEDIRFPAHKEQTSTTNRERSYYRRRGIRRKDLGIDSKVTQAAFSWLDISQAATEPERRNRLDFVGDLLNVVLSSLQPVDEEEDDESDDLPDDMDGWVFAHVAKAVVQMRDDEKPSSMWEPILTLGAHAQDWIERFFWYWFADGLQAAPDHATFVKRWSEMLRFALESPTWDPQHVRESRLDDMVFELMGYHFGLHSIAAEPAFAPVLEAMTPLYEAAIVRWFGMPRVANGFARSLAEPGYDRMLCSGVRWLHQSMSNANQSQFWGERGIESNLISVLHRCWERYHETVSADSDLQAAFLGLLTALASRGNHAAMALRERLLDSIHSSE